MNSCADQFFSYCVWTVVIVGSLAFAFAMGYGTGRDQ